MNIHILHLLQYWGRQYYWDIFTEPAVLGKAMMWPGGIYVRSRLHKPNSHSVAVRSGTPTCLHKVASSRHSAFLLVCSTNPQLATPSVTRHCIEYWFLNLHLGLVLKREVCKAKQDESGLGVGMGWQYLLPYFSQYPCPDTTTTGLDCSKIKV